MRPQIRWREAATPLTQALHADERGLELWNRAGDRQIGPRRPAPKTPLGDLYLAGASARRGHGIAGVLTGGRDAAGAVLGRDLADEVKGGAVFAEVDRLTAGGPDFDPLAACRRLQDKSKRQRRSERVAA